jgi:hypothetical protein
MLPAVERNRENIGLLPITCNVRRNSENKVQWQCCGNSVSIWDSSKARITRGHRDPSFASNTPCGSMNRQSFSAARSIFSRSSSMYRVGLSCFDPWDSPLPPSN